jgi:hypothetical protein
MVAVSHVAVRRCRDGIDRHVGIGRAVHDQPRSDHRPEVLYTVAGNELGAAVQVVAVASGAGVIVARSAQLCAFVKWGPSRVPHLPRRAGDPPPARDVIALALDRAWAAADGTARQWFTRSPRRLELIGGTGGLVMIGLASASRRPRPYRSARSTYGDTNDRN